MPGGVRGVERKTLLVTPSVSEGPGGSDGTKIPGAAPPPRPLAHARGGKRNIHHATNAVPIGAATRKKSDAISHTFVSIGPYRSPKDPGAFANSASTIVTIDATCVAARIAIASAAVPMRGRIPVAQSATNSTRLYVS